MSDQHPPPTPDGDDARATTAGDPTAGTDDPGAGTRGGADADGSTDGEAYDEAAPSGGDDEEGGEPQPPAALAAVAGASNPPRPPRRTGVFLDPEDLRGHVGALLRTILGGYEVDAFGNYTFTHEGARVFVTVNPSPIGPQVGVFSVTNLELDLTGELASFLLTTNHTLGFGAFSYDAGNRAVWLRHTLLGTTLDGPELQSAVASVATTAARLDHPIRDRFGGRTFADAPDDVQRGVEPPHVDPEPPAPNASGYL
ncbi:MAG: hypothetical protein WEB09_10695 [Nitriliruptor sp.]